MEILSTNYNCRNPFVAGFLPILDVRAEEEKLSKQSTKSIKNKNLHILMTTSSSNCKLGNNTNLINSSANLSAAKSQLPTTIYQIDVAKVCTPRINLPQLMVPKISSSTASKSINRTTSTTTKSKKALKNKRQKEAKRKRRNQRHVHFPEEDELIAIIFVIEDDDCIKEYRNKYWEFFAIDRNRFEHRVQKISKIIERILVPSHRDKIYRERFSGDEDNEENEMNRNEVKDELNATTDLGIDLNNENVRKSKSKKKKFRKELVKKNDDDDQFTTSESELERDSHFCSESECDKENRNEITLSISLSESSVTTFHFFTSN